MKPLTKEQAQELKSFIIHNEDAEVWEDDSGSVVAGVDWLVETIDSLTADSDVDSLKMAHIKVLPEYEEMFINIPLELTAMVFEDSETHIYLKQKNGSVNRYPKDMIELKYLTTDSDESKCPQCGSENVRPLHACEDCETMIEFSSKSYGNDTGTKTEVSVCPRCGSTKYEPSFIAVVSNGVLSNSQAKLCDNPFHEPKPEVSVSGEYCECGSRLIHMSNSNTLVCWNCGKKYSGKG